MRTSRESRLRFEPQSRRVRAFLGGVPVADSTRTVLLFEKNHSPVYYFPMDDVRLDLMTPTDKHTYCPYKGKASYWTIEAGGQTEPNAAWAYLKPIRSAESIAGLMAFYRNRVELVGGAESTPRS